MPRISSITSQLLLGVGQNRLYFITPNVTSVNEGSSVIFTINTTNVPDGTVLYWTTKTISGNINTDDFTDGNLSGSFTINNNTGTITRGINLDLFTEGTESFALEIRTNSISGSVRATSETIIINDTSQTPTVVSNVTTVNEGSSVTFTVTTTGVPNGTTLFWTTEAVTGLITAGDFTDNAISGSFTINNNTGTVVRGIRADNFTEGTESFRLQIRTGSTSGLVRATSATVTINDTSLSPPPTLLAWGSGNQLGTNETANRSSPVSVVGEITDWTEIAAGSSSSHSLAIRSDGSLWAWGSGSSGQLGDNTTASVRLSPVSVIGGITNWAKIAGGVNHSVGLRSDGSIWSWGNNGNGQLGTGNYVNRTSPVREGRAFTNWTEISAGGQFTLARRADGRLWAWGTNSFGKLGANYSPLVVRTLPTQVSGTITDWAKISAGYDHGLALRDNGTIWAWGRGYLGRLGTGNLIDRSSPVPITGGISNWTEISAGRQHSLALRADGTLWTWGDNNDGQLGNNNFVRRSSPVTVLGGFNDWTEISAGSFHNVALRSNGTIWAWGRGSSGQLGDNSTTLRQSPVQITGGITTWTKISAGSNHNLALRTT